jgi:HTH-type transcriptional regulator / antitoxin HipB
MMIHSSQELAVCLKDRRQQLQLSQSEVVDRVGLRQKTLSAFEIKPDSTKLETLFRLLSALDLQLQVIPKEDRDTIAQGWNEEW